MATTHNPAPLQVECGNCGGFPVGTGCYHICPFSTHFYSPEQERYDDQFYGDDDLSERYMEHCPTHGAYAGDCGGCEAEHYARLDGDPVPVTVEDFVPAAPAYSDLDLPF